MKQKSNDKKRAIHEMVCCVLSPLLPSIFFRLSILPTEREEKVEQFFQTWQKCDVFCVRITQNGLHTRMCYTLKTHVSRKQRFGISIVQSILYGKPVHRTRFYNVSKNSALKMGTIFERRGWEGARHIRYLVVSCIFPWKNEKLP